MRALTKNIGSSDVELKLDMKDQAKIKKILICRPNHRLGNLLLITPLIQEVTALFPDSEIDLMVKGNLAQTLFQNYEQIEEIISLPRKPFKTPINYLRSFWSIKKEKYDLVINVAQGSSSGRLLTQLANSRRKIFGENAGHLVNLPDSKHIAKYPVYNLRNYLSLLESSENGTPIANLDIKLSTQEIQKAKDILDKLTGNTNKTISIFTFATGEKCLSKSWWENFYSALKTKFPENNIIEILPIENVSQIDFKAPSFYSKDVREIAAVIANTEVFIGADSGIMHLASASKIPTVGLFSVTDPEIYQPYYPKSVAINALENNPMECCEIVGNILSD